jgi:hypothetical protein
MPPNGFFKIPDPFQVQHLKPDCAPDEAAFAEPLLELGNLACEPDLFEPLNPG